jgi:hypothetical protein
LRQAPAQVPYLVLFLKLLVVPAGLALIAAGVVQDPRMGLVRLDPALVAAALLVNQLALLLFAARMRLALRVFGIALGTLQALRVHLQSVFYFFVLPMTVGLEIARFAKIRALAGPSTDPGGLAYALLADRLVGAAAALLIALAAAPFVDVAGTVGWRPLAAGWPWLVAAAVVGATLLLHGRVRAHAREIVAVLRAGRAPLAGCLAISLATHACFAFAVHLAARAANVEITPLQTVFAVSAGMLFVVIPVSFAGVSPVEAASLGVLLAMGLPVEQATVFALIVYLAKLVAAFEGGAWEVAEGGGQVTRLLAGGRPDGSAS